ncbi:MAG: ADP-ribosylglycohydrolase family protein [Acidobacteriota bacterium]
MGRLFALLLLCTLLPASERRITLAELRDRIEGGWAGQMIGVSFGAPTEFRSLGKTIDGDLPAWPPDRVRNSLDQDDLYVDMTFAQVLDDKGLGATTEDFGRMFRESKYALWHANLAARRNLNRGVPAALAGDPRYNAHSDDIDFQIESDFIGMMAPGLPRAATDIAWRAGRVMNYGDGIYGGVFVSCMYGAAFFEKAPKKVVAAGLACLPKQSRYAQMIADTLAWHAADPKDWRSAWKQLDAKWDRQDPCPAGAAAPFNIDASLNGAYIALGLLYGEGDFDKTIDVSTRAGQDSDCNPSSAAGILGVMIGHKAIPDKWKSGIPSIENEKFNFTNYTFKTIVDSTVKRAIAMVKANGGKLQGETLVVRVQAPKPTKWEQFQPGKVQGRYNSTDPRWTFSGQWTVENLKCKASTKGAEAAVSFTGTGAILTGTFTNAGGKADVYLDGKLDKTIDTYHEGRGTRAGESLWHVYSLKPGNHTVRVVVLGEPYPGSQGSEIIVSDLIVFE